MNNQIVIDSLYSPRECFIPFHARDKRWSCIVAHRRAGKTVACINEIIHRAMYTKKEDAKYGYIAPYYNQAKNIAWDYLKKYAKPFTDKVNEAELKITLINGNTIRVFGADNPDALRGQYFDGVVLDEFADMRPRVWAEVIRPALADRNGWAVFIGTPKGHNAFYDIYQAAKQDPAWFALSLKASESGILTPDELVDMQRAMSEDQYNQEFEVSFDAAIIGAVYGKQMTAMDNENRICSVPYDHEAEVYTAFDLGWGDSTAIWWFQTVGREIHFIDYHEDFNQTIEHYAKIIKDKPYNYAKNGHFLPHDGNKGSTQTGRTDSQLYQSMGVPNRVLDRGEVSPQIEDVRLIMPRVWIDANKCAQGIECLKQYSYKWNDERKVFGTVPDHSWASHGADSFRYAVQAINQLKGSLSKADKLPIRSLQGASSYMGC